MKKPDINEPVAFNTAPLAMTIDWQPNQPLLVSIVTQRRIADLEYDEADVQEFVSYWLSQPQKRRNEWHWHNTFVTNIDSKPAHKKKQLRLQSSLAPTTRMADPNRPLVCHNTLKLIARYSHTTDVAEMAQDVLRKYAADTWDIIPWQPPARGNTVTASMVVKR